MISRKDIQAFVDEVVERFRPSKVILFGSYAYGQPNEDSDVDLVVVMRHRGPSPKLAARIRLACPHNFPMDLLVRSPAELRKRARMGDPFVNQVVSKGIVLHEVNHLSVREISMIARIFLSIVLPTMILLGTTGCGKSDAEKSASSDGSSPAPAINPVEQDARNAAMAEVQKHFAKTADGWITARVSGSPAAPDHFLRQIREIQIESVAAESPSDADHLNGVEWSGTVTFKKLTCREAGDAGMLLDGMADISPSRQHGQWTAWAEYTPETLSLQKVKGQWQVNDNTWLLHGTVPTAADYQRAGVQ